LEIFVFLLVFAGFLFWFALRDPLKIYKSLIGLGAAVLVGVCVWIFVISRNFSSWAFVFFMFTSITAMLIGAALALFLKGKRKRFGAIFAVALPIALFLSMEMGRFAALMN
jgi:hypothetical protein